MDHRWSPRMEMLMRCQVCIIPQDGIVWEKLLFYLSHCIWGSGCDNSLSVLFVYII